MAAMTSFHVKMLPPGEWTQSSAGVCAAASVSS